MKIDERARTEIQRVFSAGSGLERVYFPEQSGQIPDRPVLTLAILGPDIFMQDKTKAMQMVESMTRECGGSSRIFKSALLWSIADSAGSIHDEARKVLAWEAIGDEQEDLNLDETQKRQLNENIKKAQRDLKESVWRTYKNIALLGKDNQLRAVDLGLVHSSAADSMVTFILERLRKDGEVEKGISPNLLVRNWNPAFRCSRPTKTIGTIGTNRAMDYRGIASASCSRRANDDLSRTIRLHSYLPDLRKKPTTRAEGSD